MRKFSVGLVFSLVAVMAFTFTALDAGAADTIKLGFNIPLTGDNPDVADEAYVPSKIRMTLDEFRKIKQDNNLDNLEIRLYDTLLSVQIFLCDDELYLGFYPHGRKSLEAAQLRIFGQTYLSEQFLNEFDLVWDSAKPVMATDDVSSQHS